MIENEQIYKSLLVDFILELSVLIFGWLTYKLYQPFFLTYFAKNIYIHNFYLFFYHLNIKWSIIFSIDSIIQDQSSPIKFKAIFLLSSWLGPKIILSKCFSWWA